MGGGRVFFFFMHFFSGTKHPREDNPNLYYWAEMTGLHTQTCNMVQGLGAQDRNHRIMGEKFKNVIIKILDRTYMLC